MTPARAMTAARVSAYTVAAMLILICLLGIGAPLRMPIDIFPEINIPVVSVVWTYNGMSATDIQNRILSLHERQMARWPPWSTTSRASKPPVTKRVGVEKVYLHEGADVSRAVSRPAARSWCSSRAAGKIRASTCHSGLGTRPDNALGFLMQDFRRPGVVV